MKILDLKKKIGIDRIQKNKKLVFNGNKKYYSGFARGTLGEILQDSVVYNGKQEVVIISLPVSIGTTCFFYLDAH